MRGAAMADHRFLLELPIPITAASVAFYAPLRTRIQKAVSAKRKYQHEIVGQEQVPRLGMCAGAGGAAG